MGLDRDADEDARQALVGTYVLGTSNAIEKQYLRLTSAPDPATVRPERVLKLAFANVLDRWARTRDYKYVGEQFKVGRQPRRGLFLYFVMSRKLCLLISFIPLS